MKHSLELFEQPIPALRPPVPADGKAIVALAQGADQAVVGKLQGELSAYEGFRETSVVAELNGKVVGAVLAYILPYDPRTLFIWQVAIAEGEEDRGLASLMLGQVMQRKACASVTRVQTVIPSDNARVWKLFRRFARWRRTKMEVQPFITQALDPLNRHKNDNLVTIPLENGGKRAA